MLPTHSELVGLIPEDALIDAAQWYLQLDLFTPDQLLERQLAAAQTPAPAEDELALKPDAFVNAVAAGNAAPGGGAVAAAAGALAAALAEMVARLTMGKKRYEDVQDQAESIAASAEALRLSLLESIRADVTAFGKVMAAYGLPKDAPDRADAIREATYGAAESPLRVARDALAALKLAGQAAAIGNKNAITDGLAGVRMALAAVEIAALNVRVNVSGDESPAAERYRADITAVVEEARRVGAEVLAQGTTRAGL